MSKTKGDRRERDAAKLYQDAGYRVETPNHAGQYTQNQDYWNLFDGMAFRSVDELRFYQVKSNTASGIRQWMHDVTPYVPLRDVHVDFLVCHDREGWRVLKRTLWDRDGGLYTTAVDERDRDCAMGEGVVEWLRGEGR